MIWRIMFATPVVHLQVPEIEGKTGGMLISALDQLRICSLFGHNAVGNDANLTRNQITAASKRLYGAGVPWRGYGFPSLDDFLLSIPGVQIAGALKMCGPYPQGIALKRNVEPGLCFLVLK